MKIEKFKKLKNGMYELQLDNYDKLFTYEETILSEELLISKKITPSQLKRIEENNKYYDCYYMALRIIKRISKTRYELYIKLKEEYDDVLVNKVLDSLEKQNYINDEIYANSYLNNQITTTYHGPYRIKRDMEKKGISSDIIDNTIIQYTDDIQLSKIKKIVNKKINSNHNKSNNALLHKIKSDLQMDGFNISLINNIISNVTMSNDDEIREKEYNKIKSKLEKKYSGQELEYRIKQKMALKGFY